MKVLNLTTIFALLFSGTVMGQSYNNTPQQRDAPRQDERMQREQERQERPSYGQGEYDSRYDEGVRRDKQARERNWKEKKLRKRKDKHKRRYQDKKSERKQRTDY